MKSILFGSIGVLVESSEIQRKAFNEAFKEFGLDWYWNVANYIKMLEKPGGLNRIAIFINPEPASPEFKKEPNMTNIDTIDTETPVKGPHKPPSAIVSVPKKLFIGIPG